MPTIFSAPARFDSLGIFPLLAELDALATMRGDLTIDMAHVESIDGAGVGALASLFKRRHRANQTLHVANVHGVARELLNACGLLKALSMPRSLGSVGQREASPAIEHGITAAVVVQPASYDATREMIAHNDLDRRDAA